ncbi:prevent-host-death protein [Kribbella antiqua]|uniref:prevent-host-death protein n=1 Tax=Kribbella antiqua TaxID=2512217 RepID=UPI001F53F20A|nr:prevent-host-death protein [Kribbella antiqua]
MSGEAVQLVGDTMAGVVQAVESVRKLTGDLPVVVGGLAVICRLSSAHRATVDLDIVDRLRAGEPPTLELLRRTNNKYGPAGVLVTTDYGEIRVDVLEVRQAELDHPSDNSGDRLHAHSHAWASDSATEVPITVVTSRTGASVSVSTKVAEPGPLIAMKLQAVMDRGDAKAGTDLWDIVRLTLDPQCRDRALSQLLTCESQLAADIGEHVNGWFDLRRGWTLDRLAAVAGDVVSGDDVDLVRELLLGSCRR